MKFSKSSSQPQVAVPYSFCFIVISYITFHMQEISRSFQAFKRLLPNALPQANFLATIAPVARLLPLQLLHYEVGAQTSCGLATTVFDKRSTPTHRSHVISPYSTPKFHSLKSQAPLVIVWIGFHPCIEINKQSSGLLFSICFSYIFNCTPQCLSLL